MRIAPTGLFAVAALILVLPGCTERPIPPRATADRPCPPWSSFPTDRHSNRDSPHLGCSVAANLRAMLADPDDLERGRPLGPGDGEHAARAVDAFRQGKVKWGPGAGTGAPAGGGAGTP